MEDSKPVNHTVEHTAEVVVVGPTNNFKFTVGQDNREATQAFINGQGNKVTDFDIKDLQQIVDTFAAKQVGETGAKAPVVGKQDEEPGVAAAAAAPIVEEQEVTPIVEEQEQQEEQEEQQEEQQEKEPGVAAEEEPILEEENKQAEEDSKRLEEEQEQEAQPIHGEIHQLLHTDNNRLITLTEKMFAAFPDNELRESNKNLSTFNKPGYALALTDTLDDIFQDISPEEMSKGRTDHKDMLYAKQLNLIDNINKYVETIKLKPVPNVIKNFDELRGLLNSVIIKANEIWTKRVLGNSFKLPLINDDFKISEKTIEERDRLVTEATKLDGDLKSVKKLLKLPDDKVSFKAIYGHSELDEKDVPLFTSAAPFAAPLLRNSWYLPQYNMSRNFNSQIGDIKSSLNYSKNTEKYDQLRNAIYELNVLFNVNWYDKYTYKLPYPLMTGGRNFSRRYGGKSTVQTRRRKQKQQTRARRVKKSGKYTR